MTFFRETALSIGEFYISSKTSLNGFAFSSIWMVSFLVPIGSWADSATSVAVAPRVSVVRFKQEPHHWLENCRSWHWTNQDQIQTVLEKELAQFGLRVLERRGIRKIHDDEFELINQDPGSRPKKNRFLAAEYSIAGGITEMGICEEKSGSGLNLGGIISILGGPSDTDLNLKRKRMISRIGVMANVISTETGEVVRSFEARGEMQDTDYGIEAGVMGVGGAHETKQRSAIEKATNRAVRDLAEQIAAHLLGRSKQKAVQINARSGS